MLDKLLFFLSLAAVAVVYADVLVRPGMLLEPVQRWLRERWRVRAYTRLARQAAADLEGRMRIHERGQPLDEVQQTQLKAIDAAIASAEELDDQWWWLPLWGCYKCVAGQWGFWGYLLRYHGAYSLPEHLAFTAFTILTAIILHKWTQES